MRCCLKCNSEIPKHIKIDGKRKNLQRRIYCLQCSPFKHHNTIQLHKHSKESHTCPRCKILKPLGEFYSRRDGDPSVYCKPCSKSQSIDRFRLNKRKCVDYKGGCCSNCGYKTYAGALEFHHINPEEKDLTLAHTRSWSFDKVKPELDKCILLCSNCHREEHARLNGVL